MDLWAAWHRWDFERKIRRYGFGVMYVGDYETPPTWAYSVGFQDRFGTPEVVVFDVPRATAHGLMWRIFVELKLGDLQMRDGELWTEDEAGGRLVWRRVHPNHLKWDEGWLGMACRRRWKRTGSAEGVEAFQLVLPDPGGRLPWESGYDERLRPLQPELWSPRPIVPDELAAAAAV